VEPRVLQKKEENRRKWKSKMTSIASFWLTGSHKNGRLAKCSPSSFETGKERSRRAVWAGTKRMPDVYECRYLKSLGKEVKPSKRR